MNKLILIKINVNMKQIESIKVGVGGEILSAEVQGYCGKCWLSLHDGLCGCGL